MLHIPFGYLFLNEPPEVPMLLPDLRTVDKLFKKHPSQPYNPDIANAFFRAGLIESWGRGVDVMVQECRKSGSPEPVLRYEDSGFWVEFYSKATAKTPGKTPGLILSAFKETPELTIPELAMLLGKSESAVERAIKKLREAGKLVRVGPAKGGHWKVTGE
ncbi:MAG: ATP-binding protein [Mariprofundaceae bacterium]